MPRVGKYFSFDFGTSLFDHEHDHEAPKRSRVVPEPIAKQLRALPGVDGDDLDKPVDVVTRTYALQAVLNAHLKSAPGSTHYWAALTDPFHAKLGTTSAQLESALERAADLSPANTIPQELRALARDLAATRAPLQALKLDHAMGYMAGSAKAALLDVKLRAQMKLMVKAASKLEKAVANGAVPTLRDLEGQTPPAELAQHAAWMSARVRALGTWRDVDPYLSTRLHALVPDLLADARAIDALIPPRDVLPHKIGVFRTNLGFVERIATLRPESRDDAIRGLANSLLYALDHVGGAARIPRPTTSAVDAFVR